MDREYAKKMLFEYSHYGRIGPKWYQTMDLGDGLLAQGYRDSGDFIWPRIRALLPKNIKGKRILDIGCNAGVFCIRAAQEGAEVVGIDHDVKYLAQAKFLKQYFDELDGELPITYINANIELIDIKKDFGLFDYVFGMAVIYHLHYIPKMAIQISNITDVFIGRFSTRKDGQKTKLRPFTYAMRDLGFKITHNDGKHLSSRFLLKYERVK